MPKTDGAFDRADGLDRVTNRPADPSILPPPFAAPEDAAPRFVHEPATKHTPPVITDLELADREMARFTSGDRKLDDGWFHKAGCDGSCGAIAGCASQWQPEEIAAMRPTMEAFAPNIIIEPKAKPALRAKTSAERKGEPIHSGAIMYFPDALAALARLSVAGNNKHNPGEPLHWARGKSMDQMDAMCRHTICPDAIDPETGETELVAAFWRIGAQLQLQQERLLKEKGIMPYSGITP